jgi:hypothetical protein
MFYEAYYEEKDNRDTNSLGLSFFNCKVGIKHVQPPNILKR